MLCLFFFKEPEIFERFNKGFYQPDKVTLDAFQNIFYSGLKHFLQYAEKWNGYEKICEKLKNILNNFEQKCIKELTHKPNTIYVLNHSDMWTNNFLFKYENGNATNVQFVS